LKYKSYLYEEEIKPKQIMSKTAFSVQVDLTKDPSFRSAAHALIKSEVDVIGRRELREAVAEKMKLFLVPAHEEGLKRIAKEFFTAQGYSVSSSQDGLVITAFPKDSEIEAKVEAKILEALNGADLETIIERKIASSLFNIERRIQETVRETANRMLKVVTESSNPMPKQV
jgi:hypothetical protein